MGREVTTSDRAESDPAADDHPRRDARDRAGTLPRDTHRAQSPRMSESAPLGTGIDDRGDPAAMATLRRSIASCVFTQRLNATRRP